MSQRQRTFQPYMAKSGVFTVEPPGLQKKEGETIPRRNAVAKNGLVQTPDSDTHTIYDLVRRGARKFGNAKAMGWRKVVKTHNEKKMVKKTVDGQTKEEEKMWTYFELSEYSYITFNQYEKLVEQISYGLRKIGLSKGDRLHLYAPTSHKWLAMSHGAAFQAIPIATAYDTLGLDGLKHSMKQTKASAIYTDPSLLKTLHQALDDAKDIKTIIYNDQSEVDEGILKKIKESHSDIKIMSFEELRALGEANPVETEPPKADDIFGIMYTSGSTGPPKGVPILHKQVIAAIAGVNTIIGPYIGPGDGLLAYLPLAHILEFVFENACIFWGGTMGYGSVRTLSDTSVRNCSGDIREFKPSVMVGVPMVWEQVRKGIVGQVDNGSAVVKALFWGAMSAKTFLMQYGLPGSSILDAVVFKKLKAATGGRLRICMNGGGPISQDTQRFISMAICPMIGGYGLTETTGMGALQDPLCWNPRAVGTMPSSVEIKLVDFADAGYYSTNKPPQGEIWIRGDAVISSYFENEEETKESVTDDGWFKTGDIGEWDPNGQLKLIDRKKNMVKTLNGEYIALEKLESVYRTTKFVAHILVYASPDHNKPIAIIVPVEAALKKLAEQVDVQGNTLEELVKSEKLQSAALKELQGSGKAGGLVGIEIVENAVLVDDDWTPQNGLVTATQKVQRKAILKKYDQEVKKAYGDS